MDEDLVELTREELVAEVIGLRQGIRKHGDSSGQALLAPPGTVEFATGRYGPAPRDT